MPNQHNFSQGDASNILDSYESTENALMDSFKAAALKVTTLYKDSLVQNRKAYAAGYQQALQDLYGFITSHPGVSVRNHQNEQNLAPVEQGLVPVEDLLNFARSKNAQLNYEIRGANPSVEEPMNQESQANTSTAHQRFDAPRSAPAPQQANVTPQPTSTEFFTSPSPQQQLSTDTPTAKSSFNPFQIDPNTQFTFTVPSDVSTTNRPNYTDSMSLDNQDVTMDGLKRRFVTPEFTFMGRPFNINIDNGHEPPFKRVRPKRDD
ncbi:hypothetical protein INT44_005342 [Umbelopsis vinacea]|uniref:Uncharacterized protein n=1 Tax=Umbelopsis vinacea TaxID=44442 RepID=A0A8H7Q7X4_9FUNG|nr:hypothetical protein INT44_005342 [Umbelopsis vinacea]